MSPRVLSVHAAPLPRPRLLPCPRSGRRSPCLCTTSPVVLGHIMWLFGFMIALFMFWSTSWLRRGQLGRGTYALRLTESGMGPPETALGMSCGWILRLRISTWLWILLSLVRARVPTFRLWGLRFRSLAIMRQGLNKLSVIFTFGFQPFIRTLKSEDWPARRPSPSYLRPGTPIDTPMCNVCRRSSGVIEICKQSQ
jgi:hypothetical protein